MSSSPLFHTKHPWVLLSWDLDKDIPRRERLWKGEKKEVFHSLTMDVTSEKRLEI